MALYLCLRQDRRYLCNQTEAVRLQSRAWLCRMNAVLARYISGLARDVNNSHPHSERPQLWSRDGARWMSAMQQETASMRPNAAQTRTNARFSVVLRRAVQGSWSYRCANTDTAQPLLPSSVISTARAEAFCCALLSPLHPHARLLVLSDPPSKSQRAAACARSSFHPHSLRRSVPLPVQPIAEPVTEGKRSSDIYPSTRASRASDSRAPSE
jgi:hypothetical protein